MVKPKKIVLPPKGYQPNKAELEKEYDMPGADDETLRRTIFNTKVTRRKAK